MVKKILEKKIFPVNDAATTNAADPAYIEDVASRTGGAMKITGGISKRLFV